MSTPQIDRLRGLLEPPAAEAGVDLEDVTVESGKRRVLRVTVDADGGVDLDRIAELSRTLSDLLDSSDVMGEASYVLEVTTPGAERTLTEPRHWRRAAERLVAVRLSAGGELTARVTSADEEGVDVVVQPVKGRGRPKPRRLAYAEIAEARVQVEFGRKASEAGSTGAGGDDTGNDDQKEA